MAMFFWPLLAVSVVLALSNSFWWIAVGAISFCRGYYWWRYRSRPWRRIHFPAMLAYASACGYETHNAQNEGREFETRNAITNLIKMLKPDWEHDESLMFMEREFMRAREFLGDPLARESLLKREVKDVFHSELGEIELKAMLHATRDVVKINENFVFVRMAIAGLIEEQFSKKDRDEYLEAIISGHAS